MRVACCSLVLLLSVAVFAYPSVPKDGSSESSQEHSEEDPSNVLPIIEDAIEAYMDLVKIDFSAGSNADNILTSGDVLERARKILKRVPLIDGHNDLPYMLRKLVKNQLGKVNLTNLIDAEPWSSTVDSHTDIVRLRQGQVGAQFWAAYVDCGSQFKDATQKVFEQIDVVHRMVDAYPDVFEFARTAKDIEDIFARGKIASLIGVEGGHAISNSLAILRTLYNEGVRYMTLTHNCPTLWADNSQLDLPDAEPAYGGLNDFGEAVIKEMNRLGMMVDLSHVSAATMNHVLNVTSAPVIFSHSGARSVCGHVRNVPDDVLRKLPENGGVVMVVFYSTFIACNDTSTIQDVINHLQHIKTVAGVDHIGIGSDYNGVPGVPVGLEDVSKFPNLFAELLGQGWTEGELEKVAGRNLLRVMRRVEQVKDELAISGTIYEDVIKPSEKGRKLELDGGNDSCTSKDV